MSKKQKDDDEFRKISDELKKSLSHYGNFIIKQGKLNEVNDLLTSLASLRSSLAFEKIVLPTIHKFEEMSKDNNFSMLRNLFEIAARPGLKSNAKQRIIHLINERIEGMKSFEDEIMKCIFIVTLSRHHNSILLFSFLF